MSNPTLTPQLSDHAGLRPWAESPPRAKPLARIPHLLFPVVLAVSDFGLASLLCFFMLRGADAYRLGDFSLDLLIALDTALLMLALLKANHLYKIERLIKPWAMLGQLGLVWSGFFLFPFFIYLFVSPSPGFAWRWFALCYLGGFSLLAGMRFIISLVYKAAVAKNLLRRAVVLLGHEERVTPLHEYLMKNEHGIEIIAIHTLPPDLALNECQKISEIRNFMNFQQQHEIDTIILALAPEDAVPIQIILRQIAPQPVKIRLLPHAGALAPPHCGYVAAGEIPGLQLAVISDHPIPLFGLIAKNLLDRLVALVALLCFGPLMLLCAAGIKLSSPGPVLFRQRRIGYRNRIFDVYKFRSMHISKVVNHNLTTRNDPRIFAFGHVLRKLSLDELPQLFNVLKGDMSLVGPRPHMPEARAAGQFYYDIVMEYAQRHHVKPGITGWAQVNGWRGPTETTEQIEQRVKHDLHYIEHWSLTLDIKILAKTLLVGFFGKNAF